MVKLHKGRGKATFGPGFMVESTFFSDLCNLSDIICAHYLFPQIQIFSVQSQTSTSHAEFFFLSHFYKG